MCAVVCATSCVKYKAKIIVEVTDSSDNKLKKAYVLLLTEEHAREFEKGVEEEPNYYKMDSTSSNGTVQFKLKNEEPIYGIVAKEGYYYQEFYIAEPLDNKSKNKIVVKLGEVDYTSTASASSLYVKRK